MKRHALFLLPLLLLVSCGALWQTDVNKALEQARTGEYKPAADALESVVEAGNIDPKVVESLYYSWTRLGEYMKARDRFEHWATARPTAAPIRLAAGRISRLTGNYAQALTHLNAIQGAAGIGMLLLHLDAYQQERKPSIRFVDTPFE